MFIPQVFMVHLLGFRHLMRHRMGMILSPNLRSVYVPERTTHINRLSQCIPRDKGVGVRCYGAGGDPNSLGNWEWHPQQGTSSILMQRRPGVGGNAACSGNVRCAAEPAWSGGWLRSSEGSC